MTVFRLLMHTIKPWGSLRTLPPNLGKLLRNRFTIHAAMLALVWCINHSEGELSSLGFAHIQEIVKRFHSPATVETDAVSCGENYCCVRYSEETIIIMRNRKNENVWEAINSNDGIVYGFTTQSVGVIHSSTGASLGGGRVRRVRTPRGRGRDAICARWSGANAKKNNTNLFGVTRVPPGLRD
ncbi:hypothetical protein QTP88_004591 [Uroleucon formosanum]